MQPSERDLSKHQKIFSLYNTTIEPELTQWYSKVKELFSRDILSRGILLASSAYFSAILIITENHMALRICQQPLNRFNEAVPDPGVPAFHLWHRVSTAPQARCKSLLWLANLEAL